MLTVQTPCRRCSGKKRFRGKETGAKQEHWKRVGEQIHDSSVSFSTLQWFEIREDGYVHTNADLFLCTPGVHTNRALKVKHLENAAGTILV